MSIFDVIHSQRIKEQPKRNLFIKALFVLLGVFLVAQAFGVLFSSPIEEVKADPGWLNNWGYRSSVKIHNCSSDSLSNYQVEVNLQGSDPLAPNYVDFDKILVDGADIRFTDSDGATELDYWIEDFSPWVVTDNSSWYSCCGKDHPHYHTAIGTYWVAHRPMAIHYQGTRHNRTYIVYGGPDYDPYITYYDHDSDTLATPVKIADTPLSEDAHGNPTLAIDSSGYLNVFYGSHGSMFYMRRSQNSEDIESWDNEVAVKSGSYPQPHWLGSNLYVFYRRPTGIGGKEVVAYTTSTNNGSTWSTPVVIVDMGNYYHYPITIKGSDGSIHLAWTLVTNWWETSGPIYYAYSTNNGGTWYSINGDNLGFSINYTEANTAAYHVKVYNGSYREVAEDIQLDSSNNPYILLHDETASGGWNWRFAKWNGSSWSTYLITSVSNDTYEDLFTYGALRVISSSSFKVYLPKDGHDGDDGGGKMQEWSSTNGGQNWSKTADITGTSDSDQQHNFPKPVVNSTSELRIIWSYGDVSPTQVFYWGEDAKKNGKAKIWVKVPSMSAQSDKTIYMYYGNSSASSESDGDATFVFFDDFSGTSVDWNKWQSDNHSLYSIDRGGLRLSQAAREKGWDDAIYSKTTEDYDDLELSYYINAQVPNSAYGGISMTKPLTLTTYSMLFGGSAAGYRYVNTSQNGVTLYPINDVLPFKWYKATAGNIGTNSWRYKLSIDNKERVNTTRTNVITTGNAYFVGLSYVNAKAWIDRVIARKYNSCCDPITVICCGECSEEQNLE